MGNDGYNHSPYGNIAAYFTPNMGKIIRLTNSYPERF